MASSGGSCSPPCAVHLDGERREIAYAGAGHPPLLHWRAAEQTLDVLDSDGLLIGLMRWVTDREPHAFSPAIACSSTPTVCSKPRTRPRHSSATNAFTPRFRRHAARSSSELGRCILEEMIRWSGIPRDSAMM